MNDKEGYMVIMKFISQYDCFVKELKFKLKLILNLIFTTSVSCISQNIAQFQLKSDSSKHSI